MAARRTFEPCWPSVVNNGPTVRLKSGRNWSFSRSNKSEKQSKLVKIISSSVVVSSHCASSRHAATEIYVQNFKIDVFCLKKHCLLEARSFCRNFFSRQNLFFFTKTSDKTTHSAWNGPTKQSVQKIHNFTGRIFRNIVPTKSLDSTLTWLCKGNIFLLLHEVTEAPRALQLGRFIWVDFIHSLKIEENDKFSKAAQRANICPSQSLKLNVAKKGGQLMKIIDTKSFS